MSSKIKKTYSCINCGANFPKWIIEEYLLNNFNDDYFENWNDNLLMIRYDQEIIVNGYKG